MDLLERANQGIAQLRGAWTLRSPALAALAVSNASAVIASANSANARRSSTSACPLGLQLAENAHQNGDLLFIKIQLVSQEPQRAPDSEARPGLESVRVVMMGHETPSPLPVRAMRVGLVFVLVMMFVFGPIVMTAGGRRSAMALVAQAA